MRHLLLLLLLCPGLVLGQKLDDAFYRAVDSLEYLGQKEAALNLINSQSDSSGRYLFALADLTFRVDSKRKAVGLLDKHLANHPAQNDDERLWRLLEYQSIRKHKRKAPLLFAQLNADSANTARRSYALAVYYQYIEPQPKSSERYYLQAMQWLPQDAHPLLAGIIFRNLGNGAQYRGQYEQSLQYFEQERQAYAPFLATDHQAYGISYYNSANNHYHLGNFKLALENYLKTEAIWDRNPVNDTYMRFLYEATGDMYYELGIEDQALRYYDKSTLGAPVVNNDQSIALLAQGDSVLRSSSQAALPYYEAALNFRKKAFGESHPLTGACNNFLARTYARRGENERALLAFQQSLRILCDSNLALDWQAHPQLKSAPGYEKYVIEALLGKGEVLRALYQAQQDTSYLRAAYQTFALAVDYVDVVRQTHFNQDPRFFWTKLAYPIYEHAIASALDFYARLGERSYYEAAFDYSEKSRAYFLQASAQSEKAQQISGLPPAIQKQEKALIAALEEYQAKVNREQQRCDQSRPKNLALWQKEYLRLQNEYQNYLQSIKEDYPAYYNLKFQVASLPLADVQASLPDSSILIEYFWGEEQLYLFGIEKDSCYFRIASDPSRLQQEIAEFKRFLSDHEAYLKEPQLSYENFAKLGPSLCFKLLSKLIGDAPAKELIIIPSGPLSELPFEALLQQKTEAGAAVGFLDLPYLFLEYNIRYAPSASLLLGQREQQALSAQISWLGFAPDYASMNTGYAPLAHNQEELANGQKYFQGKSYYANLASESHFYAYAPQAKILHLATHATVDHEQPALSHFVLAADSAADGRLHTYELYGLRLSAELAILSACNTASGAYIAGEGLMSLGRAFQYAGCPSLLTSLWTVDDRSTAELMSYFYQHLQAGESRAEAMRSARLDYLQNADPTSTHPFFWAGFVLIGEGDELTKSSSLALGWWIGGIFLLLLGIAWWLLAKKYAGLVTSS
ncbi:MAG: CHAT domain-containing tetratricopeptide repeat protein [Bacteroidota bacterium]